jgi:hypothetical protein
VRSQCHYGQRANSGTCISYNENSEPHDPGYQLIVLNKTKERVPKAEPDPFEGCNPVYAFVVKWLLDFVETY